ncbi:F0F1 ATP synthase subunit A [Pedobacter aquatilis]|uniref:F0F1 ATP synthase subunit A n=1 Tax=Pedobacter aquatilis TaxID=351343 RepID=UPI0025B3FD59|nr:F0F1 ATP synthase subunit A [Pedobacter aquatilis]MDN3587945.1 F0F1 ATP synthase subunit A [Pedobacter aquatilis]
MDFNQVFMSKVVKVIVVFTLLTAFLSIKNNTFGQVDSVSSLPVDTAVAATQEAGAVVNHAEAHEEKEKGFDITSFIFHHISDSHYFTLFGHGEHGFHLHLPIILWTNSGLVTFSSSDFKFNDDGTQVVEKNGQRFAMAHNKIYYANATANEHGAFVSHEIKDGAEVVTNARPLDFSVTKNVFSMLLSVVLLVIVFTIVASSYKKRQGKAPKGMQSFLEPIILFVRDDIARPNLGHKYAAFMPYLLSVFFFIWLNNILGLVPFFPGGANVTGNIALTVVLAACTFLIITFKGNKYYWGHILNPPVPWWLKPLMIPVEIFGIFTKPIALAIRLFANITAGHILVMSLLCLIFIFNSLWIAPASIFFAVFIGLIEFLVAFIQAFIFTILSALFIGMAVEEHH